MLQTNLQDQLLSPVCIWEAWGPSILILLLASCKKECGTQKSLISFQAAVLPSHFQGWVVCQ